MVLWVLASISGSSTIPVDTPNQTDDSLLPGGCRQKRSKLAPASPQGGWGGGGEEERRQQYRDYMPASHSWVGLHRSSPQSNKHVSLLIFLHPAVFFFFFSLPASFVYCKKKTVFDIDSPILKASISKRNCPFTPVTCHYFL